MICSPTEVSTLVPTNVCRHSKLLNNHAVRDDQPLRTVVDVGKAVAHGDMRGVNEASSKRDHAMHRTRATTVLCCAQFHSPDGNKNPTGTSLLAPHESRKNTIWTPQPQQGENVNASIGFGSHRTREECLSLQDYLEIGMSVMAREYHVTKPSKFLESEIMRGQTTVPTTCSSSGTEQPTRSTPPQADTDSGHHANFDDNNPSAY